MTRFELDRTGWAPEAGGVGDPRRCRTRLVYSNALQAYDLGPEHPLRPERAQVALELLHGLHIAPLPDEWLAPRAATDAELMLVHAPAYIDAIKRFSLWAPDVPRGEASRYGVGPGDTPAFPGMHEAAALVAGAAVVGVREIMEGRCDHVFHPTGGLHHAHRSYASGFCIYNDAAIAIAVAVREYGARVLYLDFDAHHGDGVETAFTADPRVLTVSFHETGRCLFPGTGDVSDLGAGAGHDWAVNVPMEPFTRDDSWLEAVEGLVPMLAERFRPDLIVSQHGCDTHEWDPLTHLSLTTRSLARQAALVHHLAHTYSGGRWLALGGGGYAVYRVVPRSWALLWAEMSGRRPPARLPDEWLARYRVHDTHPLLELLYDPPEMSERPTSPEIAAVNRHTVARARQRALAMLPVPSRPGGQRNPEKA
jgi:acetoin utilization protein AcuC